MSIEALTVRIAHLEGSVEQVDKRLTAVEQAVIGLRQEMAAGLAALRQEITAGFAGLRQEMTIRFEGMDRKWLALVGMMLGSWATVMAAILTHR